jgi:hypothetical protein
MDSATSGAAAPFAQNDRVDFRCNRSRGFRGAQPFRGSEHPAQYVALLRKYKLIQINRFRLIRIAGKGGVTLDAFPVTPPPTAAGYPDAARNR